MDSARAHAALGLPPGANQERIKAEYRRLARLHHPDMNIGDAGAEERFKEISAAYERLRDKSAPVPEGAAPAWRRGADVAVNLAVPLETLLRGGKVALPGSGDRCGTCSGDGVRASSEPIQCPLCRGTGRGSITRGILRLRIDCPECHGKGSVSHLSCTDCGGTGSRRGRAGMEIVVMPRTPPGTTVRIPSRGDAGDGGAPGGDLLVTLGLAPHSRFRTSGADLVTTAWVSFADMCLGGETDVELADGGSPLTVHFGEGTVSGTVISFGGHGLPRGGGAGRGRLLVRLMPRTPSPPTPEQADLLRRWRELDCG